MRRLVIAAVLIAAPTAAAAEPLGFALDISIGGGAYLGEIGEHGNRSASHTRLGFGVARGPWAVLMSVEMPTAFGLEEAMSEAQPMPPSIDFLGIGVGPSVRRELTRGAGLRSHVRLGYHLRWLRGDTAAHRTCQVHGDCAGGFWSEHPVYPAHGPTVAIGLSFRSPQRTWLAVGVELAAGHLFLDRRGHDPDLTGTFVSLSLNLAVGRGHR